MINIKVLILIKVGNYYNEINSKSKLSYYGVCYKFHSLGQPLSMLVLEIINFFFLHVVSSHHIITYSSHITIITVQCNILVLYFFPLTSSSTSSCCLESPSFPIFFTIIISMFAFSHNISLHPTTAVILPGASVVTTAGVQIRLEEHFTA